MSTAANTSSRSDSSGWSFTLRKHASDAHSDSSNLQSDDAEEDYKILTEEEKLLKDLDLSSRQDFAEYRPNPWSIAKVNASTRKLNPSLQSSLSSSKHVAPKKPQGMIVDAFKKQSSKALPQDSTTQITNVSSRANLVRKKVPYGSSASRIHNTPSDSVPCPLAPSNVPDLDAPLNKHIHGHILEQSKTFLPVHSPSLVLSPPSSHSKAHTIGPAVPVGQESSLTTMSSNQRPTIVVDLADMSTEKDVADSLHTVSNKDQINAYSVAISASPETRTHIQGHTLPYDPAQLGFPAIREPVGASSSHTYPSTYNMAAVPTGSKYETPSIPHTPLRHAIPFNRPVIPLHRYYRAYAPATHRSDHIDDVDGRCGMSDSLYAHNMSPPSSPTPHTRSSPVPFIGHDRGYIENEGFDCWTPQPHAFSSPIRAPEPIRYPVRASRLPLPFSQQHRPDTPIASYLPRDIERAEFHDVNFARQHTLSVAMKLSPSPPPTIAPILRKLKPMHKKRDAYEAFPSSPDTQWSSLPVPKKMRNQKTTDLGKPSGRARFKLPGLSLGKAAVKMPAEYKEEEENKKSGTLRVTLYAPPPRNKKVADVNPVSTWNLVRAGHDDARLRRETPLAARRAGPSSSRLMTPPNTQLPVRIEGGDVFDDGALHIEHAMANPSAFDSITTATISAVTLPKFEGDDSRHLESSAEGPGTFSHTLPPTTTQWNYSYPSPPRIRSSPAPSDIVEPLRVESSHYAELSIGSGRLPSPPPSDYIPQAGLLSDDDEHMLEVESAFEIECAVDMNALQGRYGSTRRRVAQRKLACAEVWEMLDLPASGIEPVGARAPERPIILWAGLGGK